MSLPKRFLLLHNPSVPRIWGIWVKQLFIIHFVKILFYPTLQQSEWCYECLSKISPGYRDNATSMDKRFTEICSKRSLAPTMLEYTSHTDVTQERWVLNNFRADTPLQLRLNVNFIYLVVLVLDKAFNRRSSLENLQPYCYSFISLSSRLEILYKVGVLKNSA